jgi:CHASE3 domain sensor protein
MSLFRLSDWRSAALPLAVGFTLLIGIVVATTGLAAQLAAGNAAVQRSLAIELHLSQLLSYVQDAETGQRGYLLTGDEEYLVPYHAAVDVLPRELTELDTLIFDSPVQVVHGANLKTAIGEKLAELTSTIERRRAGALSEALKIVSEGVGQRAMVRARSIIGEMRTEEGRLLIERQLHVERQTFRVQVGVIMAFLTLMIVAALTLYKTRQQTLGIIAARDELRSSNERLIQ